MASATESSVIRGDTVYFERLFEYRRAMHDELRTCTETHTSRTATGPVVVTCAKPARHVEAGDPQHEGKVGVFPVRWPGNVADRA